MLSAVPHSFGQVVFKNRSQQEQLLRCVVVGYPMPFITWKLGQSILQRNPTPALNRARTGYVSEYTPKREGVYSCCASNGIETGVQCKEVEVPGKACREHCWLQYDRDEDDDDVCVRVRLCLC